LIVFFHDQPIVSHPYPRIFRQDMLAYDTFAGTFSCHSIQSVSCWPGVCCGVVLSCFCSLSLVRTLPPTARLF